jgi:predicted permease
MVVPTVETSKRDLYRALRILVKRPAFTFLVVLSLALGIGATTVIFSLIDGILLHPLPVPHSEEIVTVDTAASRLSRFGDTSYLDYLDFVNQSKSFQGLIAFRHLSVSMNPEMTASRPQVVWGLLVSGNYFSTLHVKPAVGRDFLPEEGQVPDKYPIAIISYGLWQQTFAGDPTIVGGPVKLNGQPFTIVGVMPRGFTGAELSFRPDIYVPAMMSAEVVPGGSRFLQARDSRSFIVRGRLKPGFSATQAQFDLGVIGSNLAQTYPISNKDANVIVRKELDYRMEGSGFLLPVVLTGLVLLVLLIACANVISLLMAKATAQLGEIATQLALGATRARLLRQLLTESTILAFLGGICGFGLAYAGINAARTLMPYSPAPQGPLFRIDYRLFLCVVLVSAMTILICGIAPAFMATGQAARDALRNRTSQSGGSFGVLVRRTMIVAQVALCLMLLIVGGLFLKGFSRLQEFDLGFNPNHVFVMAVNPGLYDYTKDRTAQFYKELLDRTRALPGVQSASLALAPPFLGANSWDISIDGYTAPQGDKFVDTFTNRTSPGYFRTLQIPMLEGRDFTENDKPDSLKVAIVTETFARRFLVGKGELLQAIGRIFRHRDGVPIQIVGVVRDSTFGVGTPVGSPPAPVFYLPFKQYGDTYMALQVRSDVDPSSMSSTLRQELHDLDGEIAPIYGLPLSTVVSARALFVPRVTAALSAVFGSIALALAMIGLYGVVAFTVERRTQEIGIRMALGAQRTDILRIILASSASLVLAGLIIGTAGAFAIAPLLSKLLVGVSPWDPTVFALLPCGMFAATLAASWLPARRATRVEPVTALRYE